METRETLGNVGSAIPSLSSLPWRVVVRIKPRGGEKMYTDHKFTEEGQDGGKCKPIDETRQEISLLPNSPTSKPGKIC